MKTTILWKGDVFIIVTFVLNGLFWGSCHGDDNTTLEYASQNNEQIATRAGIGGVRNAIFYAGWRNDYVTKFLDMKKVVKTSFVLMFIPLLFSCQTNKQIVNSDKESEILYQQALRRLKSKNL